MFLFCQTYQESISNRNSATRRSKEMDHAKLIAVRMEEARDARGISVAELARRVSIDRKRLWYGLDGQRQMRADEFVRLCAVMGLDIRFFLTPELRGELSYRRKLTIEEYGTGLCGLPTMRGSTLQHLTSAYVDARGGARPARSASPFRACASPSILKPIPCPQPSERTRLM